MRIWYNDIRDNSRYAVDVRGHRVRIGRDPANDIVLRSPFVAAEALLLLKRGNQWELSALGLNGCQLGDVELHRGESHEVSHGQVITLFPYTLTLEMPDAPQVTQEAKRDALDLEMSEVIRLVHLALLTHMDLVSGDDSTRRQSDEYLLTLERNLEEIANLQGLRTKAKAALVGHIAGHAVRGTLLGDLVASIGAQKSNVWQADQHWSRLISMVPEREDELKATVQYFVAQLELASHRGLSQQIAQVEQHFWAIWDRAEQDIHEDFQQYLALRYLKKEIKDIVFGYGPLEDLLRTPTVSEIMVVDRERIYIEKNGVLENSGRRFISDEVTQAIIERIVSKVGRRIDKSAPLVDARLTDGSRVNAIIPPLAISGPCLTIRKFPLRRLLVDDLVAKGAMTRTVAEFLQAAVIGRCNILISGGTGTGKTTLLNCLSDFIPNKERIVTIEDTAELQLQKEHVVRLETKASNVEGTGAYTIRDLVKNSLRMRPDRIVVGECRGAEALDMLQAMNTGHDGSLTTIHANTSEDVILRLEVLVQMAAPLPIDSIHRQIASAIDLIVQLRRMRDGSRKIVQVTEVVGIDPHEGGLHLKDLFALDEEDGKGKLDPTGSLPSFMGKLLDMDLIRLETFYR
jgi:Flp pilus assembly CpaF family ATPase